MTFKKIIMGGLLTAGMCLSSLALAYSALTIENQTDYDSTSVINHGACSTILGESGVTKAHSTNTVSELKIRLACIADSKNCKADVYMTNNCKGPVIATAVFDTNTGLKEIQMNGHGFNITGSGFKVTLSGSPAAAK